MSENCQLVVFSNKAYNAIIRESFDKDPVETGGILLGHILDNGVWIVMEVLPPGINSIFQYAYFEYDEEFVNYLARSVANVYKHPLDLLGLWHRHPGSMDVFSTTDDGTNTTFARQNVAGVISGLVNIDPQFRVTMYHMDHPNGRLVGRPNYEVVDIEVGDDIIPEEYFELRYYNGEDSNLHPMVPERHRNIRERTIVSEDSNERHRSAINSEENKATPIDVQRILKEQLPPCDKSQSSTPKIVDDFFVYWRASGRKWTYVLLVALVVLVAGALSISNMKKISSWVVTVSENKTPDENKANSPSLSVESLTLQVGGNSSKISVLNVPKGKKIKWCSSNPEIASVKDGIVTPKTKGVTTIYVSIDNEDIGNCIVNVNENTKAEENEENERKEENVGQSITLKCESGYVKVGESFKLMDIIEIEGTPELKYKSSAVSIAKVSNTGVVTGVSKGNALITISSDTDSIVYKINVKEK